MYRMECTLEASYAKPPQTPNDLEMELDMIKKQWTEKYARRFENWYNRRTQRRDTSNCLYDKLYHAKNWDNSFKKAVLKDKLIDLNRLKIREDFSLDLPQDIKLALKNCSNAEIRRKLDLPMMIEQSSDSTYGQYDVYCNDSADYMTFFGTQTEYLKLIATYCQIENCFDEHCMLSHACHECDADLWTDAIEQLNSIDDWEMIEQNGEEDLEQTSSVETSKNITFADERPKDVTSLHTGQEIYSDDINNDIAENDWSLKSIMQREYPIKSFEWKVTDKVDDKLVEEGLPKMITDDPNSLITRQLNFFSFLRSGVKIRVQLNGTKFHCGRLIVYFKPLTWNDDKEENFYSLTCFPHFFLDASLSNSGEIDIPFTHLLSYFSQESKTLFNDSINTLGILNVRPYNPLQAAEKSSQSLFGQIYFSLMDPYVHLPTYNIQKFSYGDGYIQGLEGMMKKAAGNAINSGLGLADKFTGGLVTGAGDAICNLLGICDKPLDPVSASPLINRTVAPLSHGAGLDRSIRLGLAPIAQTDTEPAILGATDGDFNINTLCKMPCLLEQPEWNVTQQPGTKLFDMLITPTFLSKDQIKYNGSGRYANYSPTMLAYVSRAFCYWRGSLKIKLQIVATQFHSGRLAIVYDPHGTHDVNIEDFARNKSHNMVIMDVQEQQEFTIEIPYFAVKPWLRCDKFRSNVNLTDGSTIVNPSFLDCDSAGVFRIFVLNSLVRPDNVTDKVQINVFFYAGDNFELSVINPVAPLSVRSGPTGVQYPNNPRYAWCENGDPKICNYYDQVISMYRLGQRLINNGFLTKGTNWYSPEIKINNSDSISFKYNCRKLAFYMETATGPCKDLIDSLPNYDTNASSELLEEINNRTKNILTDVDIVNTTTNLNKEQLELVQTKSDTIIARGNSLQTGVNFIGDQTKTIKSTTDQITTTVDNSDKKLDNLKTTTDKVQATSNDIQKGMTIVQPAVSTMSPLVKSTDTKVQNINVTTGATDPLIRETNDKIKIMEKTLNAVNTITTNISKDLFNASALIKDTDTNVKTLISDSRESSVKILSNIGDVLSTQNKMINELDDIATDVKYKALNSGVLYDFDKQGNTKGTIRWDRKVHMEEQALESYTTTREDDGNVITITSGNNKSSVAPHTVSENAMNLQTVLRRFFPVWVSGDIQNSNNFTIIPIPVSPSFVPNDEDTTIVSGLNRRYDVHNLAWFSRLYTYNRGSLRYKIIVNSDDADIYVWHNPVDVKKFTVSSGFDYDHLTDQMNFATELAVTRVQQGIEVEVPFYSSFNQLVHSHVSSKTDLRCQNGTLYIAVRNKSKAFNVSLFLSTGDDFLLNVLRSPPVIHEPSAYPNVDGPQSQMIQYPELQQDLTHVSNTMQMPGTFVFNKYAKGNFIDCKFPDAPLDFQINELLKQKQHMQEQMFKSMTGITDLENRYEEEIKPVVDDFHKFVISGTEFLSEVQDHTLPQVLGQAKILHKDIQTTRDDIKDFLPKLEMTLEQLQATAINVTNTSQAFGGLATAGKEACELFSGIPKMLYVSGIWLNLIEITKKFTWTNLINLIVLTCNLFTVEVTQIIKWIYDKVQTHNVFRTKANDEVMREESLTDFVEDNTSEITLTLAAIATVIYCALFGKLPTWNYIKKSIQMTVEGEEQAGEGFSDFFRSMHYTNMGCKAIANSFDFFHSWIDKIVKWFIGSECEEVLLEKQFKERSQQIQKWITEISELEDEDLYQMALSDVNLHNRFYGLVDQGNEFTKWTMEKGTPHAVCTIIRDANKRLMDMIKKIKKISPGHGFRYSPFVIMLDGASGISKSSMMHKFTDLIRNQLGVPYYNSVCVVPKTKEFLDGYEGQPIVEWDDMLQCPKQDEMVAEFINWRSNTDCIINKAHVDEKGAHFTSKAIIMSTNSGNININTIRDMNAFRNRINIKFHCKLAPGFTSDRLKTMPRDPTFSFARLDAYEVVEAGKRYELVEANLTLDQALAFARRKFVAWDFKQEEAIAEFMAEHGSMRIPPGVQITMQEEAYVIDINNDVLTEEQYLDAQMFELEFNDQPKNIQDKIYLFYHKFKGIVTKTTQTYFKLLLAKFKIVKDSVINKITKFYEAHPKLTWALGIVSGLLTSLSALKLMNGMFKTANDCVEEHYQDNVKTPVKIIRAEHYNNEPKQTIKVVRAEGQKTKWHSKKTQPEIYDNHSKVPSKLVRAEDVTYQTGQEEGTDDIEAINVARNKIHPVMCTLGWTNENQTTVLQGLAIGGKAILCPHHFFRRAKSGEFFWFLRGKDKIMIEFIEDRMIRIKDKDAVLYYMGPQFDSRKNIVDCFIKEHDLGRISSKTNAILLGTTPNGTLMEKACVAKGNVQMNYKGDDPEAITYSQDGWYYNINTLRGECGSILVACSKLLPPPAKIIGIHTAGYAHERGGFAILLTREMITSALDQLIARHGFMVYGPPLPPQVDTDEDKFNEQAAIVPDGAFSYYGTMQRQFSPAQPKTTVLRPTPFQGELYPVVKAPALLQKTKGISPLAKALTKYGKLTKPFPAKIIKAVRADILNELMTLKPDMECKPTTDEEAIFGIDGMRYCERINMKSSPGWPYQCHKKNQYGKAYLFDLEQRKINDELLEKNYKEREELAKNGQRFPSIWRDCLKDELRPLHKVESGSTRLFTIAPVDYTLLCRKYFLAFEQAFYKGHCTFFSAVGINPESYEWTMAYNRLRSKGNKCVAGDFSCYDGTLMADLMYEAGEIIDDWYKLNGEQDEHATLVRRTLIDEMIHTYQLTLNCVYKTHQGNPSGNPLTVIINTIVNAFYMRIAWMLIMKEKNPALATMVAYHTYVVDEAYGDDNRLVISDIVIEYYNQLTITQVLSEHGITYTDESKAQTDRPWKPLLDTSFLKRKYRFDEEVGSEIILPMMELDTITTLTNWYREAEDVEEQLLANQRAALDFAFFHGRQFYDDFNRKLVAKLRENDFKPLCLTYDEQLDRFLNMVHGEDGVYTNFADLGF